MISARSWTSVPCIPVTQIFISRTDPSLYSVFEMLDIWVHNRHLLFNMAKHNCLFFLFRTSFYVFFMSINAPAVQPSAQAPNPSHLRLFFAPHNPSFPMPSIGKSRLTTCHHFPGFTPAQAVVSSGSWEEN